ncbi:bromodomain and WD repeat-containing protein 1-like isoform X3 [Asterias rubens]|uniref:bromodomain and WD repeat-containing protein 1-like isoform X2 n=1 Tax=Asterias rubens TaxID=7604 RepID=UPI001455AD05|nr:bromodomain and WD repeat-containing protein 1-like isoform X2 [Asterias rubens]XP_033634690.1 bromodomain and WD repeat-containing protein 1-like isoform X3 [Asterias rubens]
MIKRSGHMVRNSKCTDAMVVYKKQTRAMDADELVKIEDTSSSEDEDRPATSRKRTAEFGSPPAKRIRSLASYDTKAWIKQCKELTQMLWNCQDSEPFRYSVDEMLYPEDIDTGEFDGILKDPQVRAIYISKRAEMRRRFEERKETRRNEFDDLMTNRGQEERSHDQEIRSHGQEFKVHGCNGRLQKTDEGDGRRRTGQD